MVRSRAKRLIREAFRATRDLWPTGIDVVVIARTAPTGLKLADVVEEWRVAGGALARKAAQARGDQLRAFAEAPKSG